MQSAIFPCRLEKSLEFSLIHSAVGPYWRLRQMIEGSSLDCRKRA
uniref:Plasmid mobilization protein n=1 Tax=Rhizobium meliloti TaxID=382 RepID=I2E1T8_RHIML|nr:plasmid mobilization protein [Sinorhizobium meliloti]